MKRGPKSKKWMKGVPRVVVSSAAGLIITVTDGE
jgi:hypothetical protein